MNERLLSSVEYKCISQQNNEKQEIIINKKKDNKLSPISLSILDSVLSHKVTLIFSQGPFNLSPLISCLFGFHRPSDILVGMPKTRFNERFEKNTDVFFSLIYKKLINSIPSSSFYFYHDVLWCNGHINEETNEMIDIEVLTRPKYGTRKYKSDYYFRINEKLIHGNLQKIPKIVSIPIDDIAPASILGEKSIKFKNENYGLKNFDPKLIIYESINERKYSFENLLLLINKSEKLDVKLVLHFSWSYLRGLSSFLAKIKNNKGVNILHLGKRICIDLKNTFKRPPDNVISLSLEGKLWDLYYPVNASIDFKIILPILNTKYNFLSSSEIVFWDWALDYRVLDIRERLKFENVDNIEKSILEFPPVLDSFLSPSETKRRCIKDGTWMTLPINDAFSIKTNENSIATCVFNGLCSDLEKCKDLAYEMRGLFTNTAISKKTLLQAYLIEKMSQLCIISSITKAEAHSDISIFIANLHPYLPTQSSFFESINYLVNSIKNLIKQYNLPRLVIQDNLVYIEIELSNGEKLKEIISKEGALQDQNVRIIKRILSTHFKNVLLCVFKKDSKLEITLKVKEPIEYLEFSQQNDLAYKKYFECFILYYAVIKNDGLYTENRFSNISLDRDINNLLILVEIDHRTEQKNEKYTYQIQLLYTDLSKMQALPKELIQNGELLIPGPIPFHTTSDQDILISHGYDALLLPFKKIIFFAYPGMNFKLLLRQIDLYNDLISENQTNVSIRDLSFSLNYTNESRRFKLPSKPQLIEIKDDSSDGDTPVDTIIRQELLYDSRADGDELDVIKTLRDIWDAIQIKLRAATPT
jgi:hypothetical protein